MTVTRLEEVPVGQIFRGLFGRWYKKLPNGRYDGPLACRVRLVNERKWRKHYPREFILYVNTRVWWGGEERFEF